MSQDATGGVQANNPGASFRALLNTSLAAIITLNSGASAPAVTYAYMLWADTTTGLLKQRDSLNANWIALGTMGVANLGLLTQAATDARYVLSGADGSAANVAGIVANTTLTVAAHSGKTIMTSPGVSALTVPVTNGFNCRIYGNSGSITLTAASGVFAMPDNSSGASVTIQASYSVGVDLVSDGTNIRIKTFGREVVANAVNSNEALALGQVRSTASDPTFADSSGLPASTNWVRGAMSAIATAAGFSSSFLTNGYIKFPSWLGGWIVQWGSVTAAAGGTAVTLPLTFPTAFFASFATSAVAGNIAAAVATNTSTITVYNSGGAGTTAWLAIGH